MTAARHVNNHWELVCGEDCTQLQYWPGKNMKGAPQSWCLVSFAQCIWVLTLWVASHVDANLFRLWWSRLCQPVPCMLSVCSNPTWTGKIYRKMTFCTSLESQRDCNHWWRSKNLSPKSLRQILRFVGTLSLIAISFGLWRNVMAKLWE